jgi:hypothetical protein
MTMNGEQLWISKNMVVAHLKGTIPIFSGKNSWIPVRIADIPVKSRTGYVSNTDLERYNI